MKKYDYNLITAIYRDKLGHLRCIDCHYRYNHVIEEPCKYCKPEGKKECANERG